MAMPNIATVLKAEISRLARKEIREESDRLKKAVAQQRTEIAGLRRRLQEMEKVVHRLDKASVKAAAVKTHAKASSDEESQVSSSHRFTAKGLASNRKRLGLSAADFGLLVGTTGQSVYAWETGKSIPRAAAISAIAGLRSLGKREVATRLAELRP